MQLQDNNMDELFRKAAADYPLRTDNDDWDSVAGRLNGGTMAKEAGKQQGLSVTGLYCCCCCWCRLA